MVSGEVRVWLDDGEVLVLLMLLDRLNDIHVLVRLVDLGGWQWAWMLRMKKVFDHWLTNWLCAIEAFTTNEVDHVRLLRGDVFFVKGIWCATCRCDQPKWQVRHIETLLLHPLLTVQLLVVYLGCLLQLHLLGRIVSGIPRCVWVHTACFRNVAVDDRVERQFGWSMKVGKLLS
jgi:hypothetical protein